MTTELSFIYNIIETLRENEYNNDERMEESFIRDLLNTYRVESLRKYSFNGIQFTDEVFQKRTLEMTMQTLIEFKTFLPKIIRTQNDYGFYLEKNGIPIPVLNSEQYYFSQRKGSFSKKLPKSKIEQNELTLYIGELNSSDIQEGSENYELIQSFHNDLQGENILVTSAHSPSVKIDLRAVFFNPSDGDNYNWEVDIYPFPAERLQELKMQLLYHEYGEVFKKLKPDEIQNTRQDYIRYHDNTDVNSNQSV